jgi:transcriptional regulator with XRE-family HTH domain
VKPNDAKLRKVRKRRNLSRRELARRVGVSHQFLGRLENGDATASADTMGRLAYELGVPLESITKAEPAGRAR